MSDLISRQAALQIIDDYIDGSFAWGAIRAKVSKLPAADRPPGKWILKDVPAPGWVQCECSVCGDYRIVPDHEDDWFSRNFCPNCGAKMDGGTK